MNFEWIETNAIPVFYMYSNLICLFVFLIAFICFIKNKNLTKREKIFSYILITHILYFFFDACWAILFYKVLDLSFSYLKIIRIFKYLLVTVASYLWFMYISIYVRADYIDDKKKLCILSIPANLNLILVIVLGLVSYEGKLYQTFIITFIPFLYMVFVAIFGSLRIISHKALINKKGALFYAWYPMSLVIFALLQIIYENIPILCFGTTFAIIVILIYSLSIKISTDGLTGLYNRNELNRYVYYNVKNSSNICVLMFDLDNFKHINDTYGHLEGDKALIATSKILKDSIKDSNAFLARFGGDEFIIICKDFRQNDINAILLKIDEATKKINQVNNDYKIGISSGFAVREENEDFLKTIERADQKLYENKKNKVRASI